MYASNKYNKIFCFTALVFLLLAYGCKKEDMPVKPVPAAFTATMKNSGSFSASGGKDTVVISAGTDGWWVTVPAGFSWCSVSQTYGAGNFLLPVTIQPNTTGFPREVTITLNPTYNLPKVNITLIQSK